MSKHVQQMAALHKKLLQDAALVPDLHLGTDGEKEKRERLRCRKGEKEKKRQTRREKQRGGRERERRAE